MAEGVLQFTARGPKAACAMELCVFAAWGPGVLARWVFLWKTEGATHLSLCFCAGLASSGLVLEAPGKEALHSCAQKERAVGSGLRAPLAGSDPFP